MNVFDIEEKLRMSKDPLDNAAGRILMKAITEDFAKDVGWVVAGWSYKKLWNDYLTIKSKGVIKTK